MHTCSKPVLFSLKSPVWKVLVNTETFSGFNFSILRMLLSQRGRGRGRGRENTPHNGLYWEALPGFRYMKK